MRIKGRAWPRTGPEIWLFLRVAGLLGILRLFLPRLKLNTLLRWLTPRQIPGSPAPARLETVVRYTDALLRHFPFPGPGKCLPRTLALYYFATRYGFPVQVCCGVRRVGESLDGHAWLSLRDRPFLERSSPSHTVTFSFPGSQVSSLSPEQRYLFTCARPATDPQEMQVLLRSDLNWQEITEMAVHYSLVPLLYTSLQRLDKKARLPAGTMMQLKTLYHQHAVQNLHMRKRLQEILSAFAKAGVPVVVLKGAALAEVVYPHIALRPMRDLDLLVRREDTGEADRLLRRLHYTALSPPRFAAWYREHHHLAPYMNRDRTLALELHHHLVPPHIGVQVPVQDLWQRARPVSIASIPTLILAPEDLLLHLCLHLAYLDRFLGVGKLRALYDMALTIQRYQGELDWERLLGRGQAYKVDRGMYATLWLARHIAGAGIPDAVLSTLAAGFHGFPYEDRVLRAVATRAILTSESTTSPLTLALLYELGTALLSPQKTGRRIGTLSRRIGQRVGRRLRQARNRAFTPLS
ncbi:MAG: lasso peptide biosynthesis B2 protein [Nitrospinota bacterium]|nr:MAG: lasso peptide biosynthesis B2 protein [Nitrospinota bacterium]